MHQMPLITTFAAWEDSALVLMARIVGLGGTAITIASISTITYRVGTIEKVDGVETYTEVVAETSINPADVLSDTLLTTPPWTIDSIGRNFTRVEPATSFPAPHARYRVQFVFTPTIGAANKFAVVYEGRINELFGQ